VKCVWKTLAGAKIAIIHYFGWSLVFFTLCPRNPSNSVNTGFSKCMKAADSWAAKADEATILLQLTL